MYNDCPTWLELAHRKLDEAVFDAYGWPHDLSDEEILARLLAINLGRAEKVIEPNTRRADGFLCTQCGKCCFELYNTIQATEDDVWRWMAEEREDILKWVSFIFADEAQTEIVAYDFPIDPQTDEEPDRCPFLRKLPRQDRYICRIQDTKPENCVRFPLDREADGIGCPGYQES